MLILSQIVKDYQLGGEAVHALRGVSLAFRKSEFVAVLGHSGCGKTTLLNIIGGLDRYTSGDLRINGRSTKDFTDGDWDAYRNHSIGFVFQTYNLIPHQTVLQNVELALTLSGIGKAARRKKAVAALERVGLGDQLMKKPNQMSGGQMQRVAIARALVNDPDILLADEPTGALDTETSVQIMEILKEISRKKLVIMVTHNPELAERYATRTVRLLDGQVTADSAPFDPAAADAAETDARREKKPSMSFLTALALSWNNLLTKKARTLLTAFAGSIGIIGIALILSLSNGIQNYIDRVQEDALSTYPLTITSETMDMSGMIQAMGEAGHGEVSHQLDAVYSNTVLSDLADSMMNMQFRSNDLSNFLSYLESEESGASGLISSVSKDYGATLQVYAADTSAGAQAINPSPIYETLMGAFYNTDTLSSLGSFGSVYSGGLDIWQELLEDPELLATQYDVIAGHWPESPDQVVLIVDKNNEINDVYLYSLGIKDPGEVGSLLDATLKGEQLNAQVQSWSYDELLAKEFKLVLPTDYYRYDAAAGTWQDMRADGDYMKQVVDGGRTLQVCGIIRPSENASAAAMSGAVGYLSALSDQVLTAVAESAPVVTQLAQPKTDLFTGLPFDDGSYIPPTAEEKAAAFRSWAEAQSSTTRASIYADIAATPSDEELAQMVDASLQDFDRDAMIDAMATAAAAEMGMDESAIRGYFSSMSDEDIRGYLAQAMTEQLKASYAASAADGLGSLSSDELAGLFDLQVAVMDQAALAKLYDRYVPPAVSASTLEQNLDALGYNDRSQPDSVSIYAATFEDKDAIVAIIDDYNARMEAAGTPEKVIRYTDYVGLLMSSITTIINAISYVLVAFVSISLVVSSIMIGIITYISVLERTKEIGILRAMGASKRDVARVFNAETAIVGFGAGFIGILLTVLLNLPISLVVQKLTDIPYLRAALPAVAAVVLIAISVALTLVAGLIPSRLAAKRDPVEALRTE